MFQTLYGQTAAALYAKAAGQNAQARQLYNASADTYYKANAAAAYDDWVRASKHWDYFLRLLVSGAQKQHVSSSCRGPKNNRLAGRVAYVWVRLPAATF